MSSSTPDLVPSDANVDRFYDRNDLHIFINDKLFFGESPCSPSHVTAYQTTLRFSSAWTPLSLSLVFTVASFDRNNLLQTSRFSGICSPGKRLEAVKLMISWVRASHAYIAFFLLSTRYLVSFQGQPPHHPRPGNIGYKQILPRPRARSRAGTPSTTPTRTASTGSPFPMTPSESRSGISTPVDTQLQVRIISFPFCDPEKIYQSIATRYPCCPSLLRDSIPYAKQEAGETHSNTYSTLLL
jgi:hypothetical protein